MTHHYDSMALSDSLTLCAQYDDLMIYLLLYITRPIRGFHFSDADNGMAVGGDFMGNVGGVFVRLSMDAIF